MKNQIKNFLLLLFLLSIWNCKQADVSVSPVVQTDTKVLTYLNSMISIMENNSINRKRIDWTNFKIKVLNEAKGATEISELKTRKAISLALSLLEDSHSFYLGSDAVFSAIPFSGAITGTNSSVSCGDVSPVLPMADKEIGYIKVPAFSGSGELADAFAQKLQNSIKSADSPIIKGWIVDLRGNTGGNMWAMIAGISPILGDGASGYFIDPEGVVSQWDYGMNGVSVYNKYGLINPNPKVAVLTDQATASSGEALTIAFKERPNTKSFGSATCGLSTANQSFRLSDGANLYLTISTMADRKKRKYGNRVEPDVAESDQQKYLKLAVDWLRE